MNTGNIDPVMSTDAGWLLFPNPFSEKIFINIPEEEKGCLHIVVSDINGLMVSEKFSCETMAEIPLPNLNNGLYVFRVVDKLGKEKTFLIQKI